MKIRVTLILFALAAALVAAPVAALAQGDIGVVNMSKVLSKYNKVEQINKALAKAKDARQEKLDAKQTSLREMKEQLDKDFEKLANEEKQKRGKQLEKGLESLQETHDKLMGELRELQAEKYKELEEDIVVAVKKVAKTKNLAMVVEKGVVFVGGDDITEDVIATLNGGAAPAKTEKKKDK